MLEHLVIFLLRNFFVGEIRRRLPHARWADNLLALHKFVLAHNRLPTNKKTFNDVLYKIKTSNEIENPLRVFTTDKEFVKLYIKAMVGDEYNIKTFAVIKSADELKNFKPPARCAIKATAGSGQVIIKQETDEVDVNVLQNWLKLNYYSISRERNYKTLQQKIIVEEIVFNNANAEDIKIFCVEGKAKLIQVDFDRQKNHTRKLYDTDWQDLNASIGYPLANKTTPRPLCLPAMLEAAEKLSSQFNFVRIDMYTDGKKFKIGEITHVHGSASEKFDSKESENKINKILFGE